MAFAQTTAAPNPSEYPVQVDVTPDREMSPLWGIPVAGFVARAIAAIPHMVVLWILNWAITIWFLIGWIWILPRIAPIDWSAVRGPAATQTARRG